MKKKGEIETKENVFSCIDDHHLAGTPRAKDQPRLARRQDWNEGRLNHESSQLAAKSNDAKY